MVCVIGAGHLGSALVRRLSQCGVEVRVVDRNEAKCAALANLDGVQVASDPSAGDAVVLCVKPADISTAAAWVAKTGPALLISVAAGITLQQLEQSAPGIPIIRTMPNIASSMGLGATGICANAIASEQDMETAHQLMSVLGVVERIDESQIDAVTGLSGSGPAYVFRMCEAMIAGGVDAGLHREAAQRLAIATINGAAALLANSGKSPSELRESVTTPNGTTAAALKVLDEQGIDNMFASAINAAKRRCQELSSQ